MGRKNKIKQPQTKLVFDDKERVEFLTGFRKRKLERKVKAREEMEEELRKAKVKIRKEQKSKLVQLYANDRPLPEIEHLIESIEVHDAGDAVVTISAMDTGAIGQAVGLIRGSNALNDVEEEEQEGSESGSEDALLSSLKRTDSLKGVKKSLEKEPENALLSSLKRTDSLKGVKKSLEKERMKLLKKDKVFKKKQILDKIKKQKQSKRLNKKLKKGKKGKDKKVGKRANRPNQK